MYLHIRSHIFDDLGKIYVMFKQYLYIYIHTHIRTELCVCVNFSLQHALAVVFAGVFLVSPSQIITNKIEPFDIHPGNREQRVLSLTQFALGPSYPYPHTLLA